MHDHDEDCNMPIDPSQPPTESTPHEPPGENERKTLKPGKGYGIISLLCGLEPVVLLCYIWCVSTTWFLTPLFAILILLSALCIPCVFFGIVFGILGRKTEGWLYASIGRMLCLFFGLLILGAILDLIFFPQPDR